MSTTTLRTPITDTELVVEGLCYESLDLLAGTVQMCGFDRLTVGGQVTLDSMDALTELAPCQLVSEVVRALNEQAQRDSYSDRINLRELGRWLDRRRG